jgi:outer membrane protein
MNAKHGGAGSTPAWRLALALVALAAAAPAWSIDPADPLGAGEAVRAAAAASLVDAPPCRAGAPFAAPLALIDAVDTALCANPQLRAAWARIGVEAGALGEARAAYLPTVAASVSRLAERTRYPGSELEASAQGRRTAYGTLSWRLFDFGTRVAKHRAGEYALAAALASHDAAAQQLMGSVVRAYFEAVTAQASFTARTEELATYAATLASARRRQAGGEAGQGDTAQAGAAHAKAALERNRAEGALRRAQVQLRLAMGVPADAALTLAEPAQEEAAVDAAGPSGSLGELLEQVRRDHPAIAAARAQLEAAWQQARATRAEGLPSVDLAVNYYQNGRPGQSSGGAATRELSVGVVLNVPIFDGFARHYKSRGAQAQVALKLANLEEIEQQVQAELAKGYAELESALGGLAPAAELLGHARQALAIATRRYDKGVADIGELMGAQNALAGARLERLRCQSEWRAARLNLLASGGQLGREALRGGR